MDIIIAGGTRYFGIPMVKKLIQDGHNITIATRGLTNDGFGDSVSRIVFDRSDEQSVQNAAFNKYYDVVIDKIAYSSNDIKRLLDHIDCGKYILMSSSAVYDNIHKDTAEHDFLPHNYAFKWCERTDYDYAEVKRQAECALALHYPNCNSVFVRYPVVIGKNDYTNRLRFYVDSIRNQIPIFVDDLHSRISFIHEDEAGLFLAYLVLCDVNGAINGCSHGDISVCEIVSYIEKKTGKKAIFSPDGKPAPYNGYPEFATLNTNKAIKTGFHFSDINSWFFEILDYYIEDPDTNDSAIP